MIAWIPAKGTSNRVPNKNIRKLCGYPLFYWSANWHMSVLHVITSFWGFPLI